MVGTIQYIWIGVQIGQFFVGVISNSILLYSLDDFKLINTIKITHYIYSMTKRDETTLLLGCKKGYIYIVTIPQFKIKRLPQLQSHEEIIYIKTTSRHVNEFALILRFGLLFVHLDSNNNKFLQNNNEMYLKKRQLNGVEEFKKDKFIVTVSGQNLDFMVLIDRKTRRIISTIQHPSSGMSTVLALQLIKGLKHYALVRDEHNLSLVDLSQQTSHLLLKQSPCYIYSWKQVGYDYDRKRDMLTVYIIKFDENGNDSEILRATYKCRE